VSTLEVGLYGKLPSHGDFLRRRVSDAFVDVWDAWLQNGLAASREVLGDRWLDTYLTSPAWRFVCSAGSCGAQALAGVMVPSVDRVGRYFPVTLVWQLPDDAIPLRVMTRCHDWFEAAERLLIDTLAADEVNFEDFDSRVVSLGNELDITPLSAVVELDPTAAESMTEADGREWRVPLGEVRQLDHLIDQVLYHRLRANLQPLVLWWTEGSVAVEPSCLLLRGLPPPRAFSAFLTGRWTAAGWHEVEGRIVASPAFTDTIVRGRAPDYYSAARSHVGLVRSSNQDALLARPDVGIWVVADGMGGHSDGEVASRMVCDALADLQPRGTLEETSEEARRRLTAVNDYLRRAAHRAVAPIHSGSTVVALLVRGGRGNILWAGDSRAYLLRDGELTQLTSDHSWMETAAHKSLTGNSDTDFDDHAITRAVGGDDLLVLDTRREHIRPGDRLLLCSDGVTRPLTNAQIHAALLERDIETCAQRLLDEVLKTRAEDNATVVVVDAR
jgi:type VI secretion system protein ImpM